MALVLNGKLLATRREKGTLTLTIRPTATIQQDGKTLGVMTADTGKFERCLIDIGADNFRAEIEWKDDSLIQFIQNTSIGEAVRLGIVPKRRGKAKRGSLEVKINGRPYIFDSFQRGGL